MYRRLVLYSDQARSPERLTELRWSDQILLLDVLLTTPRDDVPRSIEAKSFLSTSVSSARFKFERIGGRAHFSNSSKVAPSSPR